MPWSAHCHCEQHDVWFPNVTVSSAVLRCASPAELKYCKVSPKHADRKRKICINCRGRVEEESAARKTMRISDPDVNDHNSVQHLSEPPAMLEPNEISSPKSFPATSEVGASLVTNENLPSTSSQTTTNQTNNLRKSRIPYHEMKERSKIKLRSELTVAIEQLARQMTPNTPDLSILFADLTKSKPWMDLCGGQPAVPPVATEENAYLKTLAKEYHNCTDKEAAKRVREQGAKVTSKIKISGSVGSSRISFDGTATSAKNRVEAAKEMGRIQRYGDERRRILSIVARDYPYSTLSKYFSCSRSTIAGARAHAILFGRGGTPKDSLKFTRNNVSDETIEELFEFFKRDEISRPSSCRSVLVDGQETPVRYWQDTIKNIVQQYLLEFPNGIKRTYIYSHLPQNFKMNTMLAGLCNICYDDGYSNFDDIHALVHEISQQPGCEDAATALKVFSDHQRYLATEFAKQADKHSPCLELCMNFAFGECKEAHPNSCPAFTSFYGVCKLLGEKIQLCDEKKEEYGSRLQEFIKVHWQYCAHLLRTKHQAHYYRFVVSNLQPGQIVVIIDYKMKLDLGTTTRENQRMWYAKRGISVHGCYIIAKTLDGEKNAEVLDLWSEDTKQDSWFTQSALDVIFKWIGDTYGGYSVFLFSDNGPHYHNTGVIMYLAEVSEAFNLKLVEHNFFEAGEGKSVLDTHFAHISHKIIRWVRVGNDLETGEQLAELIKSMKGVKCAKLHIDRTKAPKGVPTFHLISTFGNFQFPLEGEFTGGIVAQSLAGIGKKSAKAKNSRETVANATGSTVTNDEFPVGECENIESISSTESYSVKFLQHSSESPASVPTFEPIPESYSEHSRPKSGFALKATSGSRILFTARQKEIMIEFFNKQYSTNIRSDPRDVVNAMKECGEKPLTATQIKSFWGTHSQKRKKQLENMRAHVAQLCPDANDQTT